MLPIDLEQAADRLLLEPLARVARVGPGPRRELVGRGRPIVGEGPIPAQPIAEIDAGDVEAGDGGREDALGERLGSGGHGSSLAMAGRADDERCHLRDLYHRDDAVSTPFLATGSTLRERIGQMLHRLPGTSRPRKRRPSGCWSPTA
jgi:hypothetical protein